MVNASGAIPLNDIPYFPNYTHPAQQWRSINPELREPLTLIEAPAPWTLLFNFRNFDAGDEAELTLELHLNNRWTLSEHHIITIDGSTPRSRGSLKVDDEIVSAGKLMLVSPINGPWAARLTYTQVRSSDKIVYLMKLDHTEYPQP